MAPRHLSIRLDKHVLDRLEPQGKANALSAEELAKAYGEEGLRMEAHHGIVFRTGPAGRRAGLAQGPDVWQVIELYLELKGPSEKRIQRTAKLATLDPYQVETALRYYEQYRDEIDDFIREQQEYADAAYAEWLEEQKLKEA
jgi:hypothetical protein